MTTSSTTLADWRAQVDQELAGKPFEKALVHETLEGIAIAPLYTDAPEVPRAIGDGVPFRICMRHEDGATKAEVAADLDGGADGLWIPRSAAGALPEVAPPNVVFVIDEDETACTVGGERVALVSTIAPHDAGADAADEIAIALATSVARMAAGAKALLVRVAVGRDTFIELCKVRALRLCVRKVVAAYEDAAIAMPRIHVVCSTRTMSARDPWVNMLRVTTEVFAAVLGGADLVTPLAFDRVLETPSALGRRIARNTGHVLRDESALGRVIDPGAGSYYFDTLTDALAREAWTRFRATEREGGIAKSLESGSLRARIEKVKRARQDQIAKRKMPILGVSEFANLGETLPSKPRGDATSALRDDAAFEALRAKIADAPRKVLLVPLGTPAESRARIDFARALFATVGIEAIEAEVAEALGSVPDVACLCGSDENYAAHAASVAADLIEGGSSKVALAGRPGVLEASLRQAGVDDFIFLGCDVIAVLRSLLRFA